MSHSSNGISKFCPRVVTVLKTEFHRAMSSERKGSETPECISLNRVPDSGF